MNIKMCVIYLALLLSHLLVIPLAWAAEYVPDLINYQGFLTDEQGKPISGKHNLTFNIYDDDGVDGVRVWGPQSFEAVSINEGKFNILLGNKDKSITQAFSAESGKANRYLGIAIDTGSELSPRQQILSAPFAINAEQMGGGVVKVTNVNNAPALETKIPIVFNPGEPKDLVHFPDDFKLNCKTFTVDGQTSKPESDTGYSDGAKANNWHMTVAYVEKGYQVVGGGCMTSNETLPIQSNFPYTSKVDKSRNGWGCQIWSPNGKGSNWTATSAIGCKIGPSVTPSQP